MYDLPVSLAWWSVLGISDDGDDDCNDDYEDVILIRSCCRMKILERKF